MLYTKTLYTKILKKTELNFFYTLTDKKKWLRYILSS